MTVTVVVCVLITWLGDCAAKAELVYTFPDWSPRPCEEFVRPEMRHVFLHCEKDATA